MNAPLPPAVVFDCDGTIADTESLSDRAWTEMLVRYGYAPTAEDFRAVIGHPFAQNWAYFSGRADLGDQAAFRAMLRRRFIELFETELHIYPDAVGTLRQLAADGVAIAVASSSSHGHVLRVLERGGIADLVQAVVGADDVEDHKPHPAPYLRAAALVGVPAAACAAVEDTPVGVEAAKVAGMYTVAVVRRHHEPDEFGNADRVVDTITPDVVRRCAG